ncbi:hypothetical protein [Dyella japonica]|uniref:DUF4233 domain-containing protein n=1 Tax=Dyella japonica TaxID=231455 RepID=A0ABV2JP71_9GAMM
MTTAHKVLFARILERGAAIEITQWTGRTYLACAGVLATTSLALSAPWMIGVAIAFCGCGYFVAFKLSRMAAMIGLLLSAACFALFSGIWPLALVILVFSLVEWMAIRGAEAIFKLRGRFAQSRTVRTPEN